MRNEDKLLLILREARTRSIQHPRRSRNRVGGGPRNSVNAGHHQDVALANKVEQGLEFEAVLEGGAALLLGPDHRAASGLESFDLGIERLERRVKRVRSRMSPWCSFSVSDGCDSVLPRLLNLATIL